MPRYRLTQTAEAAGRDATGKHAEPVVYWDVELDHDWLAEHHAQCDLPGWPAYPCRKGWSNWSGNPSLDWYDAPARIQEHDPSKARRIATLERLT